MRKFELSFTFRDKGWNNNIQIMTKICPSYVNDPLCYSWTHDDKCEKEIKE